MKRALIFLILILATDLVSAEAIHGRCEWSFSFPMRTFTQTGPLFFGTLPEGVIGEIATATAFPAFLPPGPSSYDFDLPIPVYANGNVAATNEILFVPHLRGAEDLIAIGGATFWMVVEYWGTGRVEVEYGGSFDGSGSLSLELEAFAFRRDAVGGGPRPGPITGEGCYEFVYPYDFRHEGPTLFGQLPEGEVSEIATASAFATYAAEGEIHSAMQIPIPVYADGSSAAEEEILFTAHMRDIFRHPTYEDLVQIFTWSGGGELQLDWSGDRIQEIRAEIEIRAWAFKQGSVATESMSFGELKRRF